MIKQLHLSKHCRPRSDTNESNCTVCYSSSFRHISMLLQYNGHVEILELVCIVIKGSLSVYFVCVEVLRPGQLNGVMSSMVNLPNNTFTGQDKSSKWLTRIVHILLLSFKGREWPWKIFYDQISLKECCRSGGWGVCVEPATSWSPVGCASNWATEVDLWVFRVIFVWMYTGTTNNCYFSRKATTISPKLQISGVSTKYFFLFLNENICEN